MTYPQIAPDTPSDSFRRAQPPQLQSPNHYGLQTDPDGQVGLGPPSARRLVGVDSMPKSTAAVARTSNSLLFTVELLFQVVLGGSTVILWGLHCCLRHQVPNSPVS